MDQLQILGPAYDDLMNSLIRHPLVVISLVLAPGLALAATTDEHAAHHPDAASAPASAGSTPLAKAKVTKPQAAPKPGATSAADQQMQAMQAMHDKMMNAGSMDERRAMLGEQMKMMESGMAMMEQMGKAAPPSVSASGPSGMAMGGAMGMGTGGMPAQHDSMMKRMDMMQMMMRMMMDRISTEPAK